MSVKKIMGIAAVAAVFAIPAMAESLKVVTLGYRTGAYAPNGIPSQDGFVDAIKLVNERDGGANGVTIEAIECETGYKTDKGVECYEALKKDSLVFIPRSTGITYQLIPRATADGTTIFSMGYGRTSAMDGKTFPWVFNFPTTYWHGASVAVNYLLGENGGSLKGKKITLLHHNSAYGKEPIRTLEKLSEKHGFELGIIPVDHPGQEQKSQWLQIRRDRPDYVLMWGWGVMNQVAIKEASNVRFPLENFMGIWWSGSEQDVVPVGEGAHGYKSLNFVKVGSDAPVFKDIKKYLVDTGKVTGDGTHIGSAIYNKTFFEAMLVVEAIKTAQKMHNTKMITKAQFRDGMENLVVTEETLASWGMAGFAAPISVSCDNHTGQGYAFVQQWDAKKGVWNKVSDDIAPDMDVIEPLIRQDAAGYAKENGITPKCMS